MQIYHTVPEVRSLKWVSPCSNQDVGMVAFLLGALKKNLFQHFAEKIVHSGVEKNLYPNSHSEIYLLYNLGTCYFTFYFFSLSLCIYIMINLVISKDNI